MQAGHPDKKNVMNKVTIPLCVVQKDTNPRLFGKYQWNQKAHAHLPTSTFIA